MDKRSKGVVMNRGSRCFPLKSQFSVVMLDTSTFILLQETICKQHYTIKFKKRNCVPYLLVEFM